MILIHYREGRYAPVVVCDICEQRITNANLAVAVGTDVYGKDPELISVLHAHKGTCHDAAEAKLGGRIKTGWDELSHHLLHLVQNIGLKPTDLVELKKTLDEIGL